MEQQPEKITAELTADELDIVLRARAEQRKTQTSRETFKAMNADQQRQYLRNAGVPLL